MRIIMKIICLILFACIYLLPSIAQAKSYAWLIGVNGKAEQLNIDENKIVQRIKLKGDPRISVSLMEVEDAITADAASNLLIITNDYGRVGQWIAAYKLSSLKFIKDFGIESRDPYFNLPKILIPPRGNKFYIIWWDSSKGVEGKGGETYSVFDKITLKKITDLSNLPIDVYKRWKFSDDGKRIYSFNFDSNEIKVHDSTTLKISESISIKALWGKPLYGKAIEDFNNDTALLVENIKLLDTDPNDIYYFTFNTIKKTSSKKISVKEVGTGSISPDGTKLVIFEYPWTHARIHIYDVHTGEKLKDLDLSKKYRTIGYLGMNAVSQDGLKLYLLAESKKSRKNALLIIDLNSPFDLIAELQDIEGTDMLYFDK